MTRNEKFKVLAKVALTALCFVLIFAAASGGLRVSAETAAESGTVSAVSAVSAVLTDNSGTTSEDTAQKGFLGQYGSLIIWVVILGAAFYFLLIRPEKRRKKEAQALRDGLHLGDTITTIGGFVGEVVKIGENTITILCGDTRMELQKWAIRTIDEVTETDIDDDDDDDDDDDGGEDVGSSESK